VSDDRLDHWLADPAVRSVHWRSAEVQPPVLWQAAREVRIAEAHRLGRLVRWRIPGVPSGQTFDELFRHEPFTVLDEGEHWSISGLCGRIWTLARDYPRLSGPEAFAAWDQRGTVRVVFAHWVQEGEDGRAMLVSEARVKPVDTSAALRLRALWGVVGPFERLVGAEPLSLAVRRAEGR